MGGEDALRKSKAFIGAPITPRKKDSKEKADFYHEETAEEAMPKRKVALENSLSTLEKHILSVEQSIRQQDEKARAMGLAGDRSGEKIALKRKKVLEQQLRNLQDSQMSLEGRIVTLEDALKDIDETSTTASISDDISSLSTAL